MSLSLLIIIDAHKMPQGRHLGTGSDTMQQVHGADVTNQNDNFACKAQFQSTAAPEK